MLSSLKILLVEDNLSLQEVLRKFLGVHNDIETAMDFNQAKVALTSEAFDVLLLNKGLPDGNGIHLIPEVRRISPRTAVIILTGDSDFNSVRKCIAAGADDYIVKSENIISDLQLRIPVALEHAKYRSSILSTEFADSLKLPKTNAELSEFSYVQFMNAAERAFLKTAVDLCDGDATQAATHIGLAKSTIFKKINELGLPKRPWNRKLESSHSGETGEKT